VERFTDMHADLDRERNDDAAGAKREEQIRGGVESTAGLYGDLQGIAWPQPAGNWRAGAALLDGLAADAAE